jgi:hypothetical protein
MLGHFRDLTIERGRHRARRDALGPCRPVPRMFFSRVRRAREVTISHSPGLPSRVRRSAASVLSSTTSGAITPCARAALSRAVSPSI